MKQTDVLEYFQQTLDGSRDKLIDELSSQLMRVKGSITLAESCTGGLVAANLVAVPGSSRWFGQSWVTYSNTAKAQQLAVLPAVLRQHGAVSGPVVDAMASGALELADANVSIAISGVAGPGGGSSASPVGTVWIGWKTPEDHTSLKFLFAGDRTQVREATVDAALTGALLHLQ